LLLPGLPALPLLALMLLFGLAWRFARTQVATPSEKADKQAAAQKDKAEDLYEMLPVDPIEVRIGQELVPLLGDGNAALMERISAFRKAFALEAGFVLPPVRLRDERRLPPAMYDIQIYGNRVAEGELVPERILGLRPGGDTHPLRGIETRDPSYGLPAVWLLEEQRAEARRAGYTLVDPVTVFLTHLGEILRKQAALLLSRAEVERLIGNVRKTNAGLVEELIPATLSLSEVQKILQNLVREKVSIRNLSLILEVLADGARVSRDHLQLTELVRQQLGGAICQSLLGKNNELSVMTLDPAIENTISSSVRNNGDKSNLVLEPRFAEQFLARLGSQAERMAKNNLLPVLLCAPELRSQLRSLTERVMPQLSIVSMAEVPSHIALRAFGMVTL
jgi:flagellar biosynthesis protein FlhA